MCWRHVGVTERGAKVRLRPWVSGSGISHYSSPWTPQTVVRARGGKSHKGSARCGHDLSLALLLWHKKLRGTNPKTRMKSLWKPNWRVAWWNYVTAKYDGTQGTHSEYQFCFCITHNDKNISASRYHHNIWMADNLSITAAEQIRFSNVSHEHISSTSLAFAGSLIHMHASHPQT